MPRFTRPQTAFLVAVCAGACATSGTRPAPATPEAVHAAQLEQQEVLITRDLRQQRRVDDVGHTLLAVATPYCTGAVTSGTGVRFANVNSFPSTYEDAARAVGFSDTVIIVSVARGSAAARAGIAVGDRVIGVNDATAPRGPNAASQLARAIATRGPAAPRLTLHHGDTTFLVDASARRDARATRGAPSSDTHVTVPADTVCGYNLTASRKDEVNAWADGSNVIVTSAMLRFVTDNDELAAVLAHEIAHNALGHVLVQQSRINGSFGAIVDTSAAVRAMNAKGETGKQPLDVGSAGLLPGPGAGRGQCRNVPARARRPAGRRGDEPLAARGPAQSRQREIRGYAPDHETAPNEARAGGARDAGEDRARREADTGRGNRQRRRRHGVAGDVRAVRGRFGVLHVRAPGAARRAHAGGGASPRAPGLSGWQRGPRVPGSTTRPKRAIARLCSTMVVRRGTTRR